MRERPKRLDRTVSPALSLDRPCVYDREWIPSITSLKRAKFIICPVFSAGRLRTCVAFLHFLFNPRKEVAIAAAPFLRTRGCDDSGPIGGSRENKKSQCCFSPYLALLYLILLFFCTFQLRPANQSLCLRLTPSSDV